MDECDMACALKLMQHKGALEKGNIIHLTRCLLDRETVKLPERTHTGVFVEHDLYFELGLLLWSYFLTIYLVYFLGSYPLEGVLR